MCLHRFAKVLTCVLVQKSSLNVYRTAEQRAYSDRKNSKEFLGCVMKSYSLMRESVADNSSTLSSYINFG